MPHLSFRTKLLLAMMLVVLGVTMATLLVTQNKVLASYNRFFIQESKAQIAFFNALRETRVNQLQDRALAFHTLVYLREPLRAYNEALEGKNETELKVAAEIVYMKSADELRHIREEDESSNSVKAAFFRLLDVNGEMIVPPIDAGFGAGPVRDTLQTILSRIGKSWTNESIQVPGLIPLETPKGRKLFEVLFTRIIDVRNGESMGSLVLGFPVDLSPLGNTAIKSGIWMDPHFFSGTIFSPAVTNFLKSMGKELKGNVSSSAAHGDLTLILDETPHRLSFVSLAQSENFPSGHQVNLYSMAEALREQRDLRWRILTFGGLGVIGALLASLVISHGLSVPIRELVAGTREIARGNLEVKVPVRSRDELGQLGSAFNEMAVGLALKEKYRSVLNLVTDKTVAQDMIDGKIALGGETRKISVLFCDIRGFTALTQNMPPQEVIQMLNEHMTALTRVVYENHGVVDKFVGDLIMAIFGAPKSYGNDAYHASNTALRMIEERNKLNATSHYKIQVGIGVATGPAVAGRMGSEDRMNYTVLGERVNLASRLCSQASRGEVIIDAVTREELGDTAQVTAMPEMHLKGFSEPIKAFRLDAINTVLKSK